MAGTRAGRVRIVSRPGLSKYAGPSRQQLFIARALPVVVPLVLKLLSLLVSLTPLFMLLVSGALLLSARTWRSIGTGLGLLVLIQVWSSWAALILLFGNFFEPAPWLFYSGITALMMGYVAWFFNLLGSLLPR